MVTGSESVGFLGPLHFAADSLLFDTVSVKRQEVMIGSGGNLPPEPQLGRAANGRFESRIRERGRGGIRTPLRRITSIMRDIGRHDPICAVGVLRITAAAYPSNAGRVERL